MDMPKVLDPINKAYPTVGQGQPLYKLLTLLARPRGATIDAAARRLGWQPHTVRARISDLRSGYGYDIRLEHRNGGAYRVVGDPVVVHGLALRRFDMAKRKLRAAKAGVK